MSTETSRPTLEAVRAWWRRTRADETCPLTKRDWDELDAAIRADERARLSAASEPFEARVEAVRDALTEYDRRDRAWDMREAARIVLRAAGVEE